MQFKSGGRTSRQQRQQQQEQQGRHAYVKGDAFAFIRLDARRRRPRERWWWLICTAISGVGARGGFRTVAVTTSDALQGCRGLLRGCGSGGARQLSRRIERTRGRVANRFDREKVE